MGIPPSVRRHVWPSDDAPALSAREVAAITVAEKMRDTDTISEVLSRFWARTHCPLCSQFGACPHRDRKRDMELIRAAKALERVQR
jgi:hypothetical protein